jgi:Ion channel
MGDFSPIQRGPRLGRKGADRTDRTIGHNGEQILIPEIIAAAKRRELTTLGLGDIVPMTKASRFCVALEAITGITLAGYS